jgi:uncharacterized repeat protein (TIGR04138 family)
MSEETHPIFRLLESDPRFKLDAYQFVREGLSYAQDVLEMGIETLPYDDDEDLDAPPERHLTGQELCMAIREYAIDQYGLMAKTVLNSWGIYKTGDFGDIVYNMIEIKLMKKSDDDHREDFDDVYDFEQAFRQDFKIKPVKK